MAEDNRVQREIDRRVRNTGRNMPPMPDFVRPIFKDGISEPQPIINEDKQPKPQVKKPKTGGFDFLKMFNFKNIKMDNDVILILVLVLVLSTEESDKLLIFALIYIML